MSALRWSANKYYADGRLLFGYVFCDYHFQKKHNVKIKYHRCG
jgi:hypothetical protein